MICKYCDAEIRPCNCEFNCPLWVDETQEMTSFCKENNYPSSIQDHQPETDPLIILIKENGYETNHSNASNT